MRGALPALRCRGNQLAMAAGLATLRYLQEQDLPARAAQRGRQLQERLKGIQQVHPFLGDIRGRGLMVGGIPGSSPCKIAWNLC